MPVRCLLLMSLLVLGACRSAPATLSLAVSEERPLHAAGQTVVVQATALDSQGDRVGDPGLRGISPPRKVASVENGVVVAPRPGGPPTPAAAGKARASVEVQVSI